MSIQTQIDRLQQAISGSFDVCANKGATIPSDKIISNLQSCINSIPTGITPTETINIYENVSDRDITYGKTLNVNVSNLTKYTCGYKSFSSVVQGIHENYDGNPLIIDVEEFSPKIFIFRPESYDTGKVLGKYSKNQHLITSSVCVYNGLVENAVLNNGMGTRFTSFITKLTASSSSGSTSVSITGGEVTLSKGGTGFLKRSEDSTEVYWYCYQTGYVIRQGEWFWEAYG